MSNWVGTLPYAFKYTDLPEDKDYIRKSCRQPSKETADGIFVLGSASPAGPNPNRAAREQAIFAISNQLLKQPDIELYEFILANGRFDAGTLRAYTPGTSYTISSAGGHPEPDPDRERYRELFYYIGLQCTDQQFLDIVCAVVRSNEQSGDKVQSFTRRRTGTRTQHVDGEVRHLRREAGARRSRSSPTATTLHGEVEGKSSSPTGVVLETGCEDADDLRPRRIGGKKSGRPVDEGEMGSSD